MEQTVFIFYVILRLEVSIVTVIFVLAVSVCFLVGSEHANAANVDNGTNDSSTANV